MLSDSTQEKHRARRRFGQNFLVDQHYIGKIVQAVQPKQGEILVEIGPGLGAITEPLLAQAGILQVIEIDRDLVARLRERFSPEQLGIHQSDALRFDFRALAAKHGQKLRVVGNLPYNISSPLLFHLVAALPAVQDIHVMLQREVVERMAAAPGSSVYGRLSVMLQYYFHIEKLFAVPAGAFRPIPQVESMVARLSPRTCSSDPERLLVNDEETFGKIVTAAFGQRRKMLANTLKPWFSAAALDALQISPQSRAEVLSVNDFVRLANALASLK